VKRLTEAQEREAVIDFACYAAAFNATQGEFNRFRQGCQVTYRDNHGTGESWYQVVDAQGRGDGRNSWTPVEHHPAGCPCGSPDCLEWPR
jgi:hypothetical protein